MPRYHVVAAAVARPNGDTELLSSIRPGRMSRYTSTTPMGPFRWPMDDMTREQGELAMTYDDTMAYVHNTGRTYWIGRFYKNYNGLIDGYITFSHSERYYHFIMDYDPQHVQIGVNYDGYPTPAHFYLARAAIMTGTSWTIAEYNAVPDPLEAAIPAAPIPAAPIPEEGETDEPTIEEGGTDFVYKGLLLFLSLVIFCQARIPIFLIALIIFVFFVMYLLSYLVFAFNGVLFVVVRFSTNAFCTLSNSFHQCI
jgi:hypothetical protein